MILTKKKIKKKLKKLFNVFLNKKTHRNTQTITAITNTKTIS